MQQTIAFLGLGVMGAPMAGHLHAAGHAVRVWNRTAAKADSFVAAHPGASTGPTPREAAEGADLVMVCVGNDDDVRAVVLGADGALAGMRAGSVLIDHTTASAELARELDAAARASGVGFVDAPVSGGQQGAVNGQLTIMAGGDEAAFERAAPVLAAYGKRVVRMGDAGAGQLTKMVNQLCIAGLLQGLSEGLAFGENAGLDLHRVVDVIAQGAAQSWQMVNRHETMIAGRYDHGFAVDWMRKDLAICRAEAAKNGSELAVANLVDGFYAEIQAEGGGRRDTSSLFERLRKRRGSRA